MNLTMPDSAKVYYDDLPPSLFFSSLFVIFTGVALILSLLYQQKTLAIFSIILLLLASSLRAWGKVSPRQLLYSASVDKDRIFPGETVNLDINIQNNKFLPVIVRLRLDVSALIAADAGDMVVTRNSGLLWYQTVRFTKCLTPAKRGFYRTGSPRLITGDFFGFFPRRLTVHDQVDIIVFPRLVPLKPVPILKRIMFGKSAAVSPVQDPIYILGTTDYQDASPARNIHWKASARHSRLQEKIFEPTEQEKLLLILEVDDFFNEKAEAAFETAIETLASLATTLSSQHYAIGFLTNSFLFGEMPEYLAIRGGTSHVTTLLERLARIDLKIRAPMADLLNTQHYFPAGISTVYFSLQPAEGISVLHQKRIPVVNITAEGTDGSSVSAFSGMSGVRYCPLSNLRLGE